AAALAELRRLEVVRKGDLHPVELLAVPRRVHHVGPVAHEVQGLPRLGDQPLRGAADVRMGSAAVHLDALPVARGAEVHAGVTEGPTGMAGDVLGLPYRTDGAGGARLRTETDPHRDVRAQRHGVGG